ncbi:predicted protein [Thalassiosira pseudonana CCMP1335]|uniref:PHD-type domain-containing protein n=1 Tax=Thalassiosira pseudonana TaxID=35128 RepID=B8BTQ0_THAPS|nr:predicted protein [Thalassiosira pseudonana CCMP1335]EED95134.1 predicted protein [Thalassiosira pseudonana CCMP1335]
MLKSMSSRALIWQAKAKKALLAKAGSTQPFDMVLLKELLFAAKQIPVTMPEEARILSTLEDRGLRHCVCGGPSDGSLMLGCDNCDRWYHGSCMKVDKATSEALTKWVCPPCTNKGSVKQPIDISTHAPDPKSLWPPFGLRSSEGAVEALGMTEEDDNVDFTVAAPPIKPTVSRPSAAHNIALLTAGTRAYRPVVANPALSAPTAATAKTTAAATTTTVVANPPMTAKMQGQSTRFASKAKASTPMQADTQSKTPVATTDPTPMDVDFPNTNSNLSVPTLAAAATKNEDVVPNHQPPSNP